MKSASDSKGGKNKTKGVPKKRGKTTKKRVKFGGTKPSRKGPAGRNTGGGKGY